MKLKIIITKEIIEKSHMCGTEGFPRIISQNCAVALAVRDIFPLASIGPVSIKLFVKNHFELLLPEEARAFIHDFDMLRTTNPKARLGLRPFEFEIELPELLIDQIKIDDIYKSETLEIVT